MSEISSLKHITQPLQRTKIFGNPYHGLVIGTSYGGSGTLDHGGPTTKTVNMPFSSDCWKYHLTGVPPVERTIEELDSDAAEGKLWLSDVVLNAGLLYGKLLFVDDFPKPRIVDFVWRDENGQVWGIGFSTVTASAISIGNTLEVCISKFGRFSSGAQEFRYETKSTGINYTAAGIPSVFHNVYLTPSQYFLYDVKSDGSAAIVGLCGSTNAVFETPYSRRVLVPIGFFEISLTLGGDGWPEVAVTTLATTTQVLGSVFANEDYAADTTYESFFVPPSTTYEVATSSFVNYTTTVEMTGKIVSMFYQDDIPVSVTVSTSEIRTYSMTGSATVTEVSGGYNVDAEKTITQNLTTSVAVSYAGISIYDYFNDGPPSVVTFSDSGSISVVPGYPEDDQGYGEGVLDTAYYDEQTKGSRLIEGELNLSPPNTSYGPVLHRYTRKVWGAIWPDSGNLVFGSVGTPSGIVSGGSAVPSSGPVPIYRSYNPITNQLSDRYTTPVCYV